MKKFIGSLFTLAIMVIIGAVVYGFATGNVRYYETFRMAGESRGYFGRKATLMESTENIENVIQSLANMEDLQGQDVYVSSFNMTNRRINLIVRDPHHPDHFDYYLYDGTNLLNPSWEKGDPYKPYADMDELLLDAIIPQGIYTFYTAVEHYIDEQAIELEDDYELMISIRIMENPDESHLAASVSGLREDVSFKADLTGEHFEVLPQ